MESKDSGSYQSSNNKSSSHSLLSSTKGVSVTIGAKGESCEIGKLERKGGT